jgi:hypothetical protein
LLMPGVDVELKLEKAKDSFAIQCANATIKPTFVVEEAWLQLKMVKINPAVMLEHAEHLSKQLPALYPVNRVVIDHKSLKSGDKEFTFEHLFHGVVPKYMVMLLASHGSFYGDYLKNPYNFKHYNLCNVTLRKDREVFPYDEFKPNFKGKSAEREYISLLESNNIFGKDVALPISYEEYLDGYTHLQFNLSANWRGTNAKPNERGVLTLQFSLADELTEAAVLILYGVFDGTVMLYADSVATDYDS